MRQGKKMSDEILCIFCEATKTALLSFIAVSIPLFIVIVNVGPIL